MTQPSHPAYAYAIDDRDRLVSVNDAWLDFAAENEAPWLTRSFVIGRPIWDFVAGAETQELYRRLFAMVREDGSLRTVPFRCDSPLLHRFMELRLAPAPQAGIELVGVLLRQRSRVYCSILDRALPRASYSFPACSVCNRIFAFGQWLEPDEAVRRLGAFDTSRAPGLEHTVCEPCRDKLGRDAGRASPA